MSRAADQPRTQGTAVIVAFDRGDSPLYIGAQRKSRSARQRYTPSERVRELRNMEQPADLTAEQWTHSDDNDLRSSVCGRQWQAELERKTQGVCEELFTAEFCDQLVPGKAAGRRDFDTIANDSVDELPLSELNKLASARAHALLNTLEEIMTLQETQQTIARCVALPMMPPSEPGRDRQKIKDLYAGLDRNSTLLCQLAALANKQTKQDQHCTHWLFSATGVPHRSGRGQDAIPINKEQ